MLEKKIKAIQAENDVFEVASISDHKKMGKTTRFLVQWEGYGPDHDTWEPEENLMCPSILTAYKKTHKLS